MVLPKEPAVHNKVDIDITLVSTNSVPCYLGVADTAPMIVVLAAMCSFKNSTELQIVRGLT